MNSSPQYERAAAEFAHAFQSNHKVVVQGVQLLFFGVWLYIGFLWGAAGIEEGFEEGLCVRYFFVRVQAQNKQCDVQFRSRN